MRCFRGSVTCPTPTSSPGRRDGLNVDLSSFVASPGGSSITACGLPPPCQSDQSISSDILAGTVQHLQHVYSMLGLGRMRCRHTAPAPSPQTCPAAWIALSARSCRDPMEKFDSNGHCRVGSRRRYKRRKKRAQFHSGEQDEPAARVLTRFADSPHLFLLLRMAAYTATRNMPIAHVHSRVSHAIFAVGHGLGLMASSGLPTYPHL
ncbi:hypothetical protein B0J13DRAFT_296508 [Dactylonectria estremocensis]|uniref:Uncharacterized protein n=1 Tax=Dactylonectria estremocensis TaxID=1079267 RepID=A0A9P9EZG7_9HYPO|nr:hypothetical protein B0J13DRAFT_296508 [Dactylonectria estremocensis]